MRGLVHDLLVLLLAFSAPGGDAALERKLVTTSYASGDCQGEVTGTTELIYERCTSIDNGFGTPQRVLYSGTCGSTTMALFPATDTKCTGTPLSESTALPYATLSGQCTDTTKGPALSSSMMMCSMAVAALRPMLVHMWLVIALVSAASLCLPTAAP